MNWLLIVLLILVILIAVVWKLRTLFQFKESISYQKGNAGPLTTARIRSITFNMGKNKRTKEEWLKAIQYNNVPDKIRNWDIITKKDYDILFVALQESWNESSPYGQMGRAICEILNDFDCYSYAYEGPPDILRKPFSVQNWVFVRKNLVSGKPGVLKGRVCHDRKAGLMCTKATVGLALEFANRRLIFMSSHLPFKSKKEDYGYANRVESMKSGLDLLNKLGSKDAGVYWAGDLNFRRNALADGQSRPEQLGYLRSQDADLGEFKELSLLFPPTCKLLEHEKLKEQLGINQITARDLRHSSTSNESTATILSNGSKAYNVEPEPGHKREPSYCDRILCRNVTPTEYYSWADGNAVDMSDHNVVVLDSTI